MCIIEVGECVMIEFAKIKSLWPESEEFFIDSTDCSGEYVFIHFITPAKLLDNSDGGTVVPAGSCIIYDRYARRRFSAYGGSLIHDWCHIRGGLDEILGKYGFECGRIYTVSDGAGITELMQKIELEILRGEVFSDSAAALLFEKLIIAVLRGASGKGRHRLIKADTVSRFSELRVRICTSYNEDWSIARMAECVNLSQSRFYALYKEIFGISPNADLQAIRIEHAKTLLLQNKYLIREIAEMTGYTNQYHFIRRFREYTGTTPGKFSGK